MLEYTQEKMISVSNLKSEMEKKYGRHFPSILKTMGFEGNDEDMVLHYYIEEEPDEEDFYTPTQVLIRKFLREEFPNDTAILIDLFC